MEAIASQPIRDPVGVAVHNKVMHEGLRLLQQSTPETPQSSGLALIRSTQSEKKALLSPFLEQAMTLFVLVAQEREVLHSKGWDMAPEYQPQVAAFSTVVMSRALSLVLTWLLELTLDGGGVVVGGSCDVEHERSLRCWRFAVRGGGAILNFCPSKSVAIASYSKRNAAYQFSEICVD